MTRLPSILISLTLSLTVAGASAAALFPPHLGHTEVRQADGGITTVFYPTLAAESAVVRGPFQLSWAENTTPAEGNRHLVVISHGSGGSPWVHTDLARTLVEHGFMVALPQHRGDNYQDPTHPGPESWVQRPREVSHSIDLVASLPALASQLDLDAVGIVGGSAGGHTALSLAGGEWSFRRFRDYCERNIAHDFSSCVGFTTLLDGSALDGLKIWAAKQIIAWRFADSNIQKYTDPRIKVAVAMVPFAADFDLDSLAYPRIPLGLVIAAKDINQIPAYHVENVHRACAAHCSVIDTLAEGGHAIMLSPLPPLAPGSIAHHLLSDPPTFNRAVEIPMLNQHITGYLKQTLQIKGDVR